MKNSMILALVALVMSATALFLRLGETPSSVAPTLPDEEGSATDADVLARIQELADENRALRDRLAMIEARPAADRVPVTTDYASRAELEALREDVLEALSGRTSLAARTPEFQAQVAETLEAIRRDEAVEQVREKHERRLERLDQDVAKIGEWLELTPAQSSRMRTALLTQYDREAEVRRLWEEGAGDEVVGAAKAELGPAFRDDLAVFLTPAQMETFESRGGGGK